MNANEPLRFSNVAPTIELISIKSSTPFTRMKKICWDLFCFKIFSNLLCYFFFAIKHENVVLKNTYSFKILSLSTTIFMITNCFPNHWYNLETRISLPESCNCVLSIPK